MRMRKGEGAAGGGGDSWRGGEGKSCAGPADHAHTPVRPRVMASGHAAGRMASGHADTVHCNGHHARVGSTSPLSSELLRGSPPSSHALAADHRNLQAAQVSAAQQRPRDACRPVGGHVESLEDGAVGRRVWLSHAGLARDEGPSEEAL